MYNLKWNDRDDSGCKDINLNPPISGQTPGPDENTIDIVKSEDEGAEFCDCFFCSMDLSDEEIMGAIKEKDFPS